MYLRAWNLRKYINTRLEAGRVDAILRPTMEHYSRHGLLTARVYEQPDDMQIYSRLPVAGDQRRWMFGAGDGSFMVPFALRPEQYISPQNPEEVGDIQLAFYVGYERSDRARRAVEEPGATTTTATSLPYLVQNPDATPEQVRIDRTTKPAPPAAIGIEILDRNLNTVVEPRLINDGAPLLLPDPAGQRPAVTRLAPEGVAQLSRASVFFINVVGERGEYEYFAGERPVLMSDSTGNIVFPIDDRTATGERRHVLPSFRARQGTFGQQLRGGPRDTPIGVYKFRNVPPQALAGAVPFELRLGIERSDVEITDEQQPTRLEVSVLDRDLRDGEESAAVTVLPETNRTSFFELPASAFATSGTGAPGSGRNFDVMIRCLTPGHFVGVQPFSLRMVTDRETFAFNLFKSLSVLWMLSVLVVIVALFSSTFLSWPIAIVLTLLILLGRWGVMQLGDATAPGIGNLVATDFGFKSPEAAQTVSKTVEALSRLLNLVAAVLPDITQFSALEDVERGIALPMSRITDSLKVLLVFGLPMVVLAYVFFRRKEVAP
jgi:hypothetical protein